MKLILLFLLMVWNITAFAENSHYTMRVDGLACPFCAYGIEKKLKAINGVFEIDINLDKGLVIVIADEQLKLTNKQMTELFQDAGFSFRSMERTAIKMKHEKQAY
jgi:copper chaperone CopZ